MGGGERKKSIRKRSSSGNSSGSGSGTWDGVGDECGNLPIASASTTMTDDGSRTLALPSPEPIRPASLAFSPPSSSSLSLSLSLSSSALPPTTAPTTLQQRRSRFAPPPSEPLLPLSPPPPPPPPGSSSSCASLCADTAQSAATTAILPRPVALPHTPAPLRRWAGGVDSSSSSASSSSSPAAAPVSASYAAAGSLMAPLSGSGLRPGPGPGPGPASVAISSANGGKGGWVQSQKQQYQHQHQHQHQHQRPRRLAPHHRIRSLLHAQYLHITRKRLPFLGRQIDRFWDLSPRGRLAAFLAFAAWKFFVTFVVMGALLKRGHEMMTTSTIVSEAAAAAAAGKGGGVSEAGRGEGASLASASAAAAAVGRVLGLEPPLSDAAIMHTDGDGDGDGNGNGRTTLKVLYVLTALSAPPPEADEELTKSWFDDVFRPVLTEGLATDGVSYPSSSLPPSLSLHVAMEMDVDLYVIAPTSPRNERRPEVNQGGTDLLASLVADALPPGVGLELWEDALPAPYPPASSSSLSSSSSSSLSPTDRADLARRHRHVIRDKLLEYDVFVSFDDLAIIKAEHVARYWWMSLELERAERETMVSRHFRIPPPPPLPPQAVFGGVVGAFPSEEGTGAEAEAAAETATNRRRRNEIIIPGLLPVNIVSNKSPNDGMKSETNGAAVNVDHTICCGSAVGRTDRLVLYDPPSVVSGGSIRRIRPPRPLSTSDLGTKSDVAAPLEWIWTMPAPQHFSLSTAVVRSRRKPHDLAWKGRFLHKNETVATSGMGGWMITRNQLLRALSSDDGACRSFLPPFDDENDNDNNNGNESNEGGDGATVDDGDDGDNDSDDAAARERYWMDGLQLFMPPSLGGCGVGRVTGTDAATISGQLVRRRTGDPQGDVGSAAVNEGASTYAVGVDDFLNRLATEREILEESYGKKRVEAQ